MSWKQRFELLSLYSTKATNTWPLRIRNSRKAKIWLRSQTLHFAKICSLQISSRCWSHVDGNLLKTRGFYRVFLNINVMSFYFHFLQRILSHPLYYLKRALFKAKKLLIFKIFFKANFIGSKTLSVMPWISQSSKITSITENFWGSRW